MYPLNKTRMSDHDRLGYLQNELEALEEKQRRFQRDTVRDPQDLAFYIKCNSYHISRIKQEIAQLQQHTK